MKAVILHGTKSNPQANWFPWLKTALEAQGIAVAVPLLPTPENQSPASWFQALAAQNIVIDDQTLLIGHSLGGTFMLHILEKQKVHRSFFISPVLDEINIPEYDALNKPFLKTPDFDWLEISNNACETFLIHGADDPYVSQEHSEFLQDQIGGDLIIIPNGGHLNDEAGYTKFDLLLEKILAPVSPEYLAQFDDDEKINASA